MGRDTTLVEAIDAFMGQDKVLILPPAVQWQRSRDEHARRLKLSLEVDGELSGQYLFIDAFPNHRSLRFCMGTIFRDHVVCRLDYDMETAHANHVGKYDGSVRLQSLVRGPHWHSWELNKHSFRMLGSFLKLPYATPLDPTIRKFDAALRWYCGVRQIAIGSHGIEFPIRESLL